MVINRVENNAGGFDLSKYKDRTGIIVIDCNQNVISFADMGCADVANKLMDALTDIVKKHNLSIVHDKKIDKKVWRKPS